MAQWLMTRLAIVGTWVRFPGPPKLNIILSNKFLCRLVNVLHHTPHQSTCHMSTISHPKAMRGGVPCPSFKAHAGNCKSQTWLEGKWATAMLNKLPILAHTPPLSILFILF